jgi:3-isopropylmalate/(R)-2-methylmalate dehydratase large subunit
MPCFVLEFSGSGVAGLQMDERAVLANMAVELGAMTGIVPADDVAIEHLMARRGLSSGQTESHRLAADPGAPYAGTLTIDLDRNFPGRSGPGRVYLANPFVVAASALAGKLAWPDLGADHS